jgi:dCMP deaminase
VIIQAARHGISIEGATLYCTNLPCVICSKMLINAGIREIYYREGYSDALSEALLKAARVAVIHFPGKE